MRFTASSYFHIGSGTLIRRGLSPTRNTAGLNQFSSGKSKMDSEASPYDFLINILDPGPKHRSWTIKKSDLGGRGLFAIEPIKKGSLVFESKPLVMGPRTDSKDHFCTKCFKICDSYNKCVKCLMILCSKECELTVEHKHICDFVTRNWKPKPNQEMYSEALGSVLMYLHSLVLQDQHILSYLQKTMKSTPNNREIDTLYSKYEIPEEHKKFIHIVNSILNINTFRIASNPSDKKISLSGLYPLSSFLNHSCIPNIRCCFKEDYTMAVYATKDIDIGEEIFICYTGFLWSTPARRCQLFKTKGFWCKCKRCEDRTEMGTNLSALKCLDKDCIGILLPITPTDPATEWCCDNCDAKVPANRICFVQSALGSLLGTLELDEQFHLETLVLERLAKFVPYCSHIFVDLRLRLAQKIGFEGPKMNGRNLLNPSLPSTELNNFKLLRLIPIFCNLTLRW